LLGLINSVLILYGIIVYIVFWYKAWAFIQDEHARISPGKVIWMMLVPILNLYGNYLILVGFAKNYNDFINRRKIETEHLPVNLFLLFYINEMLAILLSFFYRRLFPGYTSVFELVILNTIAQFLVLIGAAISASFVIVKVIQSVNKLTEHSLTTQPYNA
jgi:phosphotransferase system  glucose/maltose/N-acetylglucosamine-specific IIC component